MPSAPPGQLVPGQTQPLSRHKDKLSCSQPLPSPGSHVPSQASHLCRYSHKTLPQPSQDCGDGHGLLWCQPCWEREAAGHPLPHPTAAPSGKASRDSGSAGLEAQVEEQGGERKGKKRQIVVPGPRCSQGPLYEARGKPPSWLLLALPCSARALHKPQQPGHGSAPLPVTPQKKTQHHPYSGEIPWA